MSHKAGKKLFLPILVAVVVVNVVDTLVLVFESCAVRIRILGLGSSCLLIGAFLGILGRWIE